MSAPEYEASTLKSDPDRCPYCGARLDGSPHTCRIEEPAGPATDFAHSQTAVAATGPAGGAAGDAATDVTLDIADSQPRGRAGSSVSAPEPLLDDLVGTFVDERYEIVRRIGQGGMGVVYEARHRTLGSRFALKVLLRSRDSDDGARFLQEAKLASRIRHPNTVFISDFGILPDGRLYLLMEHLRGSTLADTIKREGPLPPARACAIALQIAHGLQSVHENDVVHRDLKPENIFLLNEAGRADFVKIVDFGIAKAVGELLPMSAAQGPDALAATGEHPSLLAVPLTSLSDSERLTRTGTLLGTPLYLSPEQANRETVDGRADQYSLGCILYEMLSGSVPFSGPSLAQLLSQHQRQAPPPFAQRSPLLNIPPALEALVQRLLKKNPQQRFASMAKVAQAIEQSLLEKPAPASAAEEPVAAVKSDSSNIELKSSAIAAPEPPKSRQLPVALAAGATLFAVLGGLFFVDRARHQAEQAKPVISPLTAAELDRARTQSLAVLTADLATPNRELRLGAVTACGLTRDSRLRPSIEPFLAGPDDELASQAAYSLGQIGDRQALPALQKTLATAPALLVQLAAARALLELGEESGRQFLLHSGLQASERPVQLRSAFLLCDVEDATAQQLLLDTASRSDTPEPVVLDILSCLTRGTNPAQALDKLRTRFGSRSGAAKLAVAGRLAQAGDATAREYLHGLLKNVPPGSSARLTLDQLTAARALAAPDEARVAPLLRSVIEQARDPGDPAAYRLAVEGLALSGELVDVRLLLRKLSNLTDLRLRQSTAVAILQLAATDGLAMEDLGLRWAADALYASNWRVRGAAVAALAHSQAPDAVALLGRMLHDEGVEVRKIAARALGSRRDHAALLALKAGLSDSDGVVRLEVLRAIARIGEYLRTHDHVEDLREVRGWFDQVTQEAIAPAWATSGALLAIGDESQRSLLTKWRELDVSGQRFVVEVGVLDRDALVQALAASDLGVRLAAARQLVMLGDARARSVIAEAVARGGPLAIDGYEMLLRLGDDVSAALLRAAHDPQIEVRRHLLDVLGELLFHTPPQDALPMLQLVLRVLAGDTDPTLRAYAATLLARRPIGDVLATTRRIEATPRPNSDSTSGEIKKPLESPTEIATAPAPQSGKSLFVQADEALSQGAKAARRQDFAQAQKLLARARGLCGSPEAASGDKKSCANLIAEATLELARTYDQQQRWPEAMTEFQRLLRGGAGEARQFEAQKAMVRLGLRLGQVVVQLTIGGKCRKEVHWLLPGPATIKVAGKPTEVTAVAGKTVTLGSCQ